MNTSFNKLMIAAATAGALGFGMTGLAQAETNQAPLMLAAETVDNAQEAVSDTWITSKVKSSFVADDSLSALDIKVETNQGVVSLSGVVSSDAERDLAVSTAKGIKGVKAVSADGLKSAD
ncbi:MAG: BON domain-containing protein [Pseudomonadota bacterium]